MRTHLSMLPLLLALSLTACGEDPAPVEPTDTPAPEPATPPPPAYPKEDALADLVPPSPVDDAPRPTPRASPSPKASPPPAPTPEPAPPDPASLGEMSLSKVVLAERVVDRAPRGEGDRFAEGSEVTCWNRVENPGGGRRTIRHRWSHEGRVKSTIKLSVKGNNWRTWSSIPVYGPGEWRVEVLDEADRVLAALPFTVE